MIKKSQETEELFTNFNKMFHKCKSLIKELKINHKIEVTKDDESYFQIAWPKSGKNKLYVKPVCTNLGGAFETHDGKNPSSEGLKLAEKYLMQVKYTKKYGRLLISYAEALDSINEGQEVDMNNLNEIVKCMKELYKLTEDSKKKGRKL